jgi:hypothetical protein
LNEDEEEEEAANIGLVMKRGWKGSEEEGKGAGRDTQR